MPHRAAPAPPTPPEGTPSPPPGPSPPQAPTSQPPTPHPLSQVAAPFWTGSGRAEAEPKRERGQAEGALARGAEAEAPEAGRCAGGAASSRFPGFWPRPLST